MLYFNRIDISEGIDVNKTSDSKECGIGHYWYFLNKGLKFQINVCHRFINDVYAPQRYCYFKHF